MFMIYVHDGTPHDGTICIPSGYSTNLNTVISALLPMCPPVLAKKSCVDPDKVICVKFQVIFRHLTKFLKLTQIPMKDHLENCKVCFSCSNSMYSFKSFLETS